MKIQCQCFFEKDLNFCIYYDSLTTIVLSYSLEKLALQLNCDALVTVLNGEYLTSSVIRQGFTVVKKIAYENYRDPVTSQAIFKDLAADNYKNCTLVVKLLKKNFNEQSKM